MNDNAELLASILDAYPYEIVYVNREHIVCFLNKAARERYGESVKVGSSIFNCHNERSKGKIEEFLRRADAGEDEMYENLNMTKGEREFFVPVRDSEGKVIGYFERHEDYWTPDNPQKPVNVPKYIPY